MRLSRAHGTYQLETSKTLGFRWHLKSVVKSKKTVKTLFKYRFTILLERNQKKGKKAGDRCRCLNFMCVKLTPDQALVCRLFIKLLILFKPCLNM